MSSKTAGEIEQERGQFKKLILANPNYFGNLRQSKFKPVKKIVKDTSYEELTCVGLNQNVSTLEATIAIKRPFGYGGDLCSPGSREYVRFFINYDDSGWLDAGAGSSKCS